MTKNVGLTYVKDFTFPAEQGFTGSASSAGVHQVKGYQRGGRVKKMGEGGYYGKPGDQYPKLKSGPTGKRSAMPKNVKRHGGPVKKQMGGYMGPEREIAVDDVKITVPKNRGGSVHDKLKHEGAKMGYAYGGQVKDTSSEFVEKRGKQDTMDHGVQPAQKGNNEAEVEAGGNKRLKAGYKRGGGVHSVRATGGTGLQEPSARRKAARKGMPKNVKAKGGLARYAHGGKARTPYKGYNKQPGGSGNEDKRYMS